MRTETLTFDLATWLWFATYRLVMMIICAKLLSNPIMYNKVMGRTRPDFTEVYAQSLSADCDLDLWSSDMVLVRDTSSCHDDHLCQIIFKSHHVRLSYGPDTILEHTHRTHGQDNLYMPFRHFMAGAWWIFLNVDSYDKYVSAIRKDVLVERTYLFHGS